MKGKLLQISYVLVFFGLGFYLGTVSSVKKKETGVDAFLDEAKTKVEVKEQDFFNTPLFHFSGKNYALKDLPISAQQEIARDIIVYQRKTSKLVQTVVTQSVSSNKENGPINFGEIPDLNSFYSSMVTDAQVEELYKKNIEKFGKNHDPKHIKLNIRVQLLAKRVTEHSKKVISDLYDKKTYFFYNKLPTLPREWLQLDEFPNLGNPALAKYKIDIFMNYLCDDCPSLVGQIAEVLKKYDPKKVQISLVPVSSKSLSVDYYINKSALCFYEQDEKLFWKYNIALLKQAGNLKLLKEDNLDSARETLDGILGDQTYSSIDKDKIFACIKDEKIDKEGKYTSKVVQRLRIAKENFQFLTVFPFPVILVNGKMIMNDLSLSENIDLGVNKKWH